MVKRPVIERIVKWGIVVIIGLFLSLILGNRTFYHSILNASSSSTSTQTLLDQEPYALFILTLSIAFASGVGRYLFPRSIGVVIGEFWALLFIALARSLSSLRIHIVLLITKRPAIILVVFVRMAIIVLIAGPLLYQLLVAPFNPHKYDNLFFQILIPFVVIDFIVALYQGLEATVTGSLLRVSSLVLLFLFMASVVGVGQIYTTLLHKIPISGPFATIEIVFRYLLIYYFSATLCGLLWFLLGEWPDSIEKRRLFYLPDWLKHPKHKYLGLYLLSMLSIICILIWMVISIDVLVLVIIFPFFTVIALGLETSRLIFQEYRKIREAFSGIKPYLEVMMAPLVAFIVSYFAIIAWFAVVFYQFDHFYQFNHFKWGHFSSHFIAFWQSLYYSMLTITTLGFDQIKPVDSLMQALTTFEAIIGTAWLVIVFAALTSYLSPYFAKISQRRKMAPVLIKSEGAIRTHTKTVTFTVCKRGQGDFTSISDAIQAIPHTSKDVRTRIEVWPGRYVETESIVIDKPLEIVGKDPQTTVSSRTAVTVEAIGGPCIVMAMDGNASLTGLSVRGRISNGNAYPAIDIQAGALLLSDCDISAQSLACISVHGKDTNPTIENCTIHGGSIGVLFDDDSQGSMKYCHILPPGQVGISIARDSNPTITDCHISNRRTGIVVEENGRGTIICCDIRGNLFGIEVGSQGNPKIEKCNVFKQLRDGVYIKKDGQGIFNTCQVYDNWRHGITIEESGDPLIDHCEIYGNGDVGVAVQRGAKGTVTSNRMYDIGNAHWRIETPNSMKHQDNDHEPA